MAASSNTCTTCACQVCSKIRFDIDQIFHVLEIYGWMLDAYIVDFFQENLWQRLPSSWRDFLDEISPEDLGRWILKESESKRVWPLSLLALRRFIQVTEISRDHSDKSGLRCLSSIPKSSLQSQAEAKLDGDERSAMNKRFDNLFSKHVKKKKRYEINVISQTAARCAEEADRDCVVDIGSGMGHLARVLAYRHNLRVICVEQNEALLAEARKWDEQLLVSLAKHIPDFRGRKPQHVSLQVGVSSCAARQLADQLTRVFTENFEPTPRGCSSEKSGFGLIGLHPCGDLASTLLRLYADEGKARFICIVGCCYMKLTLRIPALDAGGFIMETYCCYSGDTERGYPMSQYLSSKETNYRLSYAALEVACHAVEKHCDKLKTNDYHDLIVHAYRAVLEYLLVEKNPALRRTQLKNTKIKEDTSFQEYCEAATEFLDAKDRPTETDFERLDVKTYLRQWKKVLTFGSLRLLIAPLVESLVLFDRFLYLSEKNLCPSLKAEFDSRVSPRNFLLVSIKN